MSALGVRSAEPDPGVHTDLEIAPVRSRAERAAFVNLPYDAYRGQATWRAPLRFERKAQLDPIRGWRT